MFRVEFDEHVTEWFTFLLERQNVLIRILEELVLQVNLVYYGLPCSFLEFICLLVGLLVHIQDG